jgi:hypothetical protein
MSDNFDAAFGVSLVLTLILGLIALPLAGIVIFLNL